jgi:predicted DCC family thiol-disulfide oxidoreductase YuxK
MQDTIVFYDGDCGLCSYVVQIILNNEREEKLSFCSLQSEFAIEFLRQKGYNAKLLNTMYFFNGTKIYRKSNAALQITPFLKPKWWIFLVFWIVPFFIRDVFYNLIANIRKKIIPTTCSIEKRNSTRFIA